MVPELRAFQNEFLRPNRNFHEVGCSRAKSGHKWCLSSEHGSPGFCSKMAANGLDRECNVNKQRDNVSNDENEGTERLANFNLCTCSRCELREIVRECICCLQQPESSVYRVKGIFHTTNNFN